MSRRPGGDRPATTTLSLSPALYAAALYTRAGRARAAETVGASERAPQERETESLAESVPSRSRPFRDSTAQQCPRRRRRAVAVSARFVSLSYVYISSSVRAACIVHMQCDKSACAEV